MPANQTFWTASVGSRDPQEPAAVECGDDTQGINGSKPQSEQRYEIRFSASEQFLKKLERARAIYSQSPRLEAILEKGLDELLERHDPERKQARREKRKSRNRGEAPTQPKASLAHELSMLTSKQKEMIGKDRASGEPPKASVQVELIPAVIGKKSLSKRDQSPASRLRHIPAPLRDAVFNRDKGRCTYVAGSGVRCESTAHLQIDHIEPFCWGGEHTLSNLRLLCGKHNRLAAREMSLAKRLPLISGKGVINLGQNRSSSGQTDDWQNSFGDPEGTTDALDGHRWAAYCRTESEPTAAGKPGGLE